MNFITALRAHNLDYVLEEHQFIPIIPMHGKQFAELISNIKRDNLKVRIDQDCDPDGYFACRILVDTFKLIGFTNYEITHHTVKRHNLSSAEVTGICNNHYDVVFILDSSSNDMQAIQEITNSGAIVCVVDHHESHYMFEAYPKSAIIINPAIDAAYRKVCYNCLSAGAIMSLLCAYTLHTAFGIKPPTDLYLYGVITLYSDIMDMNNPYNIAFVSRFQNTQTIDSKLIKLFWDKYTHFDKSYISFKLIPRLNALFRTENFSLLYDLFFNEQEINYDSIKKRLEEHYEECKRYVERLVSSSEVTEYSTIVLAVIDKNSEYYSRNFTGLVASKFASIYNKPVLCLHRTTPLEWQGSVRDCMSRNLLELFRPMCYAEGHPAAFGVKIEVAEIKATIKFVEELLAEQSTTDNSVIVLDWDKNPDYAADMPLMAEYNEFGGQGLPVALGAIEIKRGFKIYRNENHISVYGNGQKYICCVPTLDIGDIMLVKPTLSGSDYTNFVNAVHLHN